MHQIEIERKFLIKMPDSKHLGGNFWDITQTYLTSPEGVSRRLRLAFDGSRELLFYNEKRPRGAMSSDELENIISQDAYVQLIKEADTALQTIVKRRYFVLYRGQKLEIDVYPFWKRHAILEIELEDAGQRVCIPDWISVVRDVSSESEFKNRALASHIPQIE